MSSHGTDAGARPAHIPPQKQQVHQLLHIISAEPVLGNAHAVAGDHCLALHIDPGNLLQLLARQPAGREDDIPRGLPEVGGKCLEAVGVLADEDRV